MKRPNLKKADITSFLKLGCPKTGDKTKFKLVRVNVVIEDKMSQLIILYTLLINYLNE